MRIGIPKRKKKKKENFWSFNKEGTTLDIKAFEKIQNADQYFTKDNSLLELCVVNDLNTKENVQLYFLPRIYDTKHSWKPMKMKERLKVKQNKLNDNSSKGVEKGLKFSKLSSYQMSRYYKEMKPEDKERVKRILTLHYTAKLENGSYIAFVRVLNKGEYLNSVNKFENMSCTLDYQDHRNIFSVNFSEMVLIGKKKKGGGESSSKKIKNSHRAFAIPFTIDYHTHIVEMDSIRRDRPRKLQKAEKYEVNFSFKRQFRHINEKWKFEISIGQIFENNSEVSENFSIPAGQPYLFYLQRMYPEQKVLIRSGRDKITFNLKKKKQPIQIIDFPSNDRKKSNTKLYDVTVSTKYRRIRYFEGLVTKPTLYPYHLHGFVGRNSSEFKKFSSELRNLRDYHTIYQCYKARLIIKIKMRQMKDWEVINMYIRQLLFLVSYYIRICEHNYLKRDVKRLFMIDTDDAQKTFPKEFSEWNDKYYSTRTTSNNNRKKKKKKKKDLSPSLNQGGGASPQFSFSQTKREQIFSAATRGGRRGRFAGNNSNQRGNEAPSELTIVEFLEIIDNKPELLHQEFVSSKKKDIYHVQKKIQKKMTISSSEEQQEQLYSVFKLLSHQRNRAREASFTGFMIPTMDRPDQQIYFLLYNLLFRSDNLMKVLEHFEEKTQRYVDWLLENKTGLSDREFNSKYRQPPSGSAAAAAAAAPPKTPRTPRGGGSSKKLERQYNDLFYEEVFDFEHYEKLISPYSPDPALSHNLSMLLHGHQKLIPFLCKKIIPTLKPLHTHFQPIVDSLDHKNIQQAELLIRYHQKRAEFDGITPENLFATPGGPGSVRSSRHSSAVSLQGLKQQPQFGRRRQSFIRSISNEYVVRKTSLSPHKKKKGKQKKKSLLPSTPSSPVVAGGGIIQSSSSSSFSSSSSSFQRNGFIDQMIGKYKDRQFEELKVRFGKKYHQKYKKARSNIQNIFKTLQNEKIIAECKEAFGLPGIREDILEEFYENDFWEIMDPTEYQNNSIYVLYEEILEKNQIEARKKKEEKAMKMKLLLQKDSDRQKGRVMKLEEEEEEEIEEEDSSTPSSPRTPTRNRRHSPSSHSKRRKGRARFTLDSKKYDEDEIFGDVREELGSLNKKIRERNDKIDMEKNSLSQSQRRKFNKGVERKKKQKTLNVPTTYILRIISRFCRKLSLKYDSYVRRLDLLNQDRLIFTQRDLEEVEGEDDEEDSSDEDEALINDLEEESDKKNRKKNRRKKNRRKKKKNEKDKAKKLVMRRTSSLTNRRLKKFLRYQMENMMKTVKADFAPNPIPYLYLIPKNKFDVLETKIEILLQEKLKNAMKKTVEVYSSFNGKYVDTARIQIRLNLWDILNRKVWKETLSVYEKEGKVSLPKLLREIPFLRQIEDMREKDFRRRSNLLQQKLKMKREMAAKNSSSSSDDDDDDDKKKKKKEEEDDEDASYSDDDDEDEDSDSDDSDSDTESSSESSDSEEELEEELKPFQDYRRFSTLQKVNAHYNSGRDLAVFSCREGLSSEIEIHLETSLKMLRTYHQSIIRYNPFLSPTSKLFSASHKSFDVKGKFGSRQGVVFLPSPEDGSLGGPGKTKKEKIIQKLLAERNVIFSEFNNSPLFSRIIRKQLLPSIEAVFYHGFVSEYKSYWFFPRNTSLWKLSKYYFEDNVKYMNIFECIQMVFPKFGNEGGGGKDKSKKSKMKTQSSNPNASAIGHHLHHHQEDQPYHRIITSGSHHDPSSIRRHLSKSQHHQLSKQGEDMWDSLKFRSLLCKLLTDKKVGMYFEDFSSHPKVQGYFSYNSIIRQPTVRREIGKRFQLIDENYELNIHFELGLVHT